MEATATSPATEDDPTEATNTAEHVEAKDSEKPAEESNGSAARSDLREQGRDRAYPRDRSQSQTTSVLVKNLRDSVR